jgi:hypothetical protein
MATCYKHSEYGSTEEVDIKTIPLSTWMVGSKPSIIRLVSSVPDDCFFLLPAYQQDGVLTDWQPQITGKAKRCETFVQAAQREILEEIGFSFFPRSLHLVHTQHEKMSDVHFFVVPLETHATGSDDILVRTECTSRSCYDDDYRRRVSIHLVFRGHIADLKTIIATRKRISSSDTGGTVIFAVPKTVLLSYLLP